MKNGLVPAGIGVSCVNLQCHLQLFRAVAVALRNRRILADEPRLVPRNPPVHTSHGGSVALGEFTAPDPKTFF